jgi:hypothetical protein
MSPNRIIGILVGIKLFFSSRVASLRYLEDLSLTSITIGVHDAVMQITKMCERSKIA